MRAVRVLHPQSPRRYAPRRLLLSCSGDGSSSSDPDCTGMDDRHGVNAQGESPERWQMDPGRCDGGKTRNDKARRLPQMGTGRTLHTWIDVSVQGARRAPWRSGNRTGRPCHENDFRISELTPCPCHRQSDRVTFGCVKSPKPVLPLERSSRSPFVSDNRSKRGDGRRRRHSEWELRRRGRVPRWQADRLQRGVAL